MKKNILRMMAAILTLGGMTAMTACSDSDADDAGLSPQDKSIVILYENDVHCSITGYAQIAGWRDAINLADTAYAAAVSVGDFLQGSTIGAISKGQYVIDVMRHVGYDAIALGNHEFDYGIDRMTSLLQQLDAPVICANYYTTDAAAPCYAPYVMHQYGNRLVAFVGALTPETMLLERYAFYDSEGHQLADLRQDDFYELVQQAVSDARHAGADYVVLLSHVGEQTQSMGFDSHQLVTHISGIDVVLDGHTHSVIEAETVTDAAGKPVVVTQTGTQFANIGKLLITADGHISVSLTPTSDVPYESSAVTAAIDAVNSLVDEQTRQAVGITDFPLVVSENGEWVVRSSETNMGDLVTDALRHVMQADIALVNGGGIRNDIAAGTITYGDIVSVLPFFNPLLKIRATGEEIISTLRQCCANTPESDGDFPQCSGIRFTIHTHSHTIDHVQIQLPDGTYADIDPDATYTVALTDYCHHGGGFHDALINCSIIPTDSTVYDDAQALSEYIAQALGGTIPQRYSAPQGRITILDD